VAPQPGGNTAPTPPASGSSNLLPPGAATPQPGSDSSKAGSSESSNAGSSSTASSSGSSGAGLLPPGAKPSTDGGSGLLPPGASSSGAANAGKQRALPSADSSTSTTKGPQVDTGEKGVIQAPGGKKISLEEPVKKAGEGADAVELRKRTPEEKARTRLIKNAIIFSICALFLLGALYLLVM